MTCFNRSHSRCRTMTLQEILNFQLTWWGLYGGACAEALSVCGDLLPPAYVVRREDDIFSLFVCHPGVTPWSLVTCPFLELGVWISLVSGPKSFPGGIPQSGCCWGEGRHPSQVCSWVGDTPLTEDFLVQIQLTSISALTPTQDTHRLTGPRSNRNYTVIPLTKKVLCRRSLLPMTFTDIF